MKSLRLCFALLFCTLICTAKIHAAPLNGRLAYIHNGAAYVVTLPNGKPKMLPNSRGAHTVSVAPRGGAILLLVSEKGAARVRITRPPYATAQALSKPLDTFEGSNAQWSSDGARVLLGAWEKNYLWQVGTNKITALPTGQATLSRDGQQIAMASEKELKLRQIGGKERILFSIQKPQPLFDALKSAKYPQNVGELQDAIAPDLWKDEHQWNFGSTVFSADGQTLWFACNAGTGAGAAGNMTYCWFACDLKTGRLSVLSKLGEQFSRQPSDVSLSPDGKKLLYVTSVHSSAIENPCAVSVLDLPTQKETVVAKMTVEKKYNANLVFGACWAPDSRAVAASALYYDTEQVMKNPNWEPRDHDFTLYLRDLNGRTLRTIAGAVAPSWGN